MLETICYIINAIPVILLGAVVVSAIVFSIVKD